MRALDMPRRFWPWLVILVVVIGAWFGWQHRQLLRYQATAHQHFVDQFQNGIRGAYSGTESARRSLAQGNSAVAGARLADVDYHLQMMRTGVTGMSIRLQADVMPLSVAGRYQGEARNLQDELLSDSASSDLTLRLDNLSHDLTLLLELLGADEQRDWLTHATADDFGARYQSWREKALMKPDVP